MQLPTLNQIIGWDTGTWGKAIPLWEKAIKGKNELRCLEIGANQGGLSLWLSMQREVKSIECSDLDKTEHKSALLHNQFPELKEKISYRNLNITDTAITGSYDLIVFKSVIGACGRIQENGKDIAMNNIYRLLTSGGILLFAENMQGHLLHRWFRKRFVKWSEGWSYCSMEEWKRWLLPYQSHEIYFDGFFSAMGRKEWQKRILRKVDNIIVNKISDENKFMCYGFAIK